VYSVAPHAGRGGWTWYTGAAGWMYQAGMGGILGIRREGDSFIIDPCLPAHWPGYEATVMLAGTRYDIRVTVGPKRGRGISVAVLDGVRVDVPAGPVRLPLDGAVHKVEVVA